jgi:hypothetical protein
LAPGRTVGHQRYPIRLRGRHPLQPEPELLLHYQVNPFMRLSSKSVHIIIKYVNSFMQWTLHIVVLHSTITILDQNCGLSICIIYMYLYLHTFILFYILYQLLYQKRIETEQQMKNIIVARLFIARFWIDVTLHKSFLLKKNHFLDSCSNFYQSAEFR